MPIVKITEQLRNFWVSFMRSAGRNGKKPTGKSHSLQTAVRGTHWPLQCDAKAGIRSKVDIFVDRGAGLLTLI